VEQLASASPLKFIVGNSVIHTDRLVRRLVTITVTVLETIKAKNFPCLQFLVQTAGIVILTLCLNGTTTETLLRILRLTEISSGRLQDMRNAVKQLHHSKMKVLDLILIFIYLFIFILRSLIFNLWRQLPCSSMTDSLRMPIGKLWTNTPRSVILTSRLEESLGDCTCQIQCITRILILEKCEARSGNGSEYPFPQTRWEGSCDRVQRFGHFLYFMEIIVRKS